PAVRNKTLDLFLCDGCSQHVDYQLITKTEAKTKYFVTDNDLQIIDACRVYTRRHNQYKNTTTLYHLVDVEHVFANKHKVTTVDINTTLKMLKQQKEAKRILRTANKQRRIEERQQQLVNA